MRLFYLFLLLTFNILFVSAPTYSISYSNIKVVEVIDGDTVRLSNGKLLRYIGIDTPEIRIKRGDKFIYTPQPFSLQAKEFNQRLVEGKYVRIEFDVDKLDAYGRILGYCFVGNTFVNAELIKAGWAVLYTRPPNVKYTDLFVRLQQQARNNRRGIWQDEKIISADEAYEHINEIGVVRGKVYDTYRSQKVVYLNFDRDYKKDFTVVIFKDCWGLFEKENIDPVQFYKRKNVEVYGRIREYNGPEIIICSPSQITIVE